MQKKTALHGVAFGLSAYGMWGFFPLYFHQLSHVPAADIISNRAVWGCLFVALILLFTRQWRGAVTAARSSRALGLLATAMLLIGANWLVFMIAVERQQVVASSLGYFLTPLVNVLLALVILKERLNWKEWVAVGLAVVAVFNEILALGELPWISLVLAATFGTYGLVRKKIQVDVISGLFLETLLMLPLAVFYAAWQGRTGHVVFGGHDASTELLLALSGVLTALPLLAFAAAAQRLGLAALGMLMYINPTLQFATAVLHFGEPLQPARLVTFGLIWLGLAVYSWSAWQKYRPATA
ncbi:MAG TPA: EamA family transporter RarD [Rhodocyclaceae bacterium]|nr:EamA family transporter RarD [Rhodocyclaceae bacterium]